MGVAAPSGPALLPLWIAPRSNVREILEGVSLADVASAELPVGVSALANTPAPGKPLTR